MIDHPYKKQPQRAFWSKAVSTSFALSDLISEPLFRPGDKVMSAGSCFAANLVPYLEGAGFTYVRTERAHPWFAGLPENFSYRDFSAAYGNIYTARQMRQLLERCVSQFKPAEDRWHEDGLVKDPYRPALAYPARSNAEFDALTAQHLSAVRTAFEQCSVFVFTLGLTEAWVSSVDGAVFPACPGTIAGTFDPERHEFHNFRVSEVSDDLRGLIHGLREINPTVRVILTVSPVPLVATATKEHVLTATTHSKSILRAAASEIVESEREVSYFPAYEIVTGPQAPYEAFEPDRRNVSKAAVQSVMTALLGECKPVPVVGARPDALTEVAKRISDIECEEAAVER